MMISRYCVHKGRTILFSEEQKTFFFIIIVFKLNTSAIIQSPSAPSFSQDGVKHVSVRGGTIYFMAPCLRRRRERGAMLKC